MMVATTMLATVSAAANVTSGVLDIGDFTGYSIAAVLTGSDVAGTVSLEVSLDNSTFVTVASTSTAITSSTDTIFNISDAQYRYVRCKWVYSSGTGNLTVTSFISEPYKASI